MVSARKKLSSVFGHTRSNSAWSESGFDRLKFTSAMDFQYAMIESTRAMRSATLRDGLGFFIATSSLRHGNATRFSFWLRRQDQSKLICWDGPVVAAVFLTGPRLAAFAFEA
jgi:hypothetical protein